MSGATRLAAGPLALAAGFACRTPDPATDPGDLTMALEMKPACLKCGAATPPEGEAYVCSYECTFCRACTKAVAHVCPNCSGELVPRPRRTANPGD